MIKKIPIAILFIVLQHSLNAQQDSESNLNNIIDTYEAKIDTIDKKT